MKSGWKKSVSAAIIVWHGSVRSVVKNVGGTVAGGVHMMKSVVLTTSQEFPTFVPAPALINTYA